MYNEIDRLVRGFLNMFPNNQSGCPMRQDQKTKENQAPMETEGESSQDDDDMGCEILDVPAEPVKITKDDASPPEYNSTGDKKTEASSLPSGSNTSKKRVTFKNNSGENSRGVKFQIPSNSQQKDQSKDCNFLHILIFVLLTFFLFFSGPQIMQAVQLLTEMGFPNEGQWLAKILERFDGDITKALDHLMQNPNK